MRKTRILAHFIRSTLLVWIGGIINVGCKTTQPNFEWEEPQTIQLTQVYIPHSVTDSMRSFYREHKKPVLDKVVREERWLNKERKSFFVNDAGKFVNALNQILDRTDEGEGLRIYLGSYETQKFSAFDDRNVKIPREKLVLIFAPTREIYDASEKREKYPDKGKYWLLADKNDRFVEVDEQAVRKLIDAYRTKKKEKLNKTLSEHDLSQKIYETHSVLYKPNTIRTIVDEICYQVDSNPNKKLGVKIIPVSYSDKDLTVKKYGMSYLLSRRLTLHFAFTNAAGKQLDMAKFDRDRYGEIHNSLIKSTVISAWDTGDPTPPFPDDGIK